MLSLTLFYCQWRPTGRLKPLPCLQAATVRSKINLRRLKKRESELLNVNVVWDGPQNLKGEVWIASEAAGKSMADTAAAVSG